MTTPDVTVVVAVYNTMPYLTRCLTSLVEQTIGRERLEVVAVDDGSTDGSGRELDRFARLYPDTVRVVHQPNSGGPAVPSNRALDLARGRYVFFIGADDYLGPEALARLVAAADRWGSDVVLGRTLGVNSRNIHQAIFAGTQEQVDLFDSALPWSLSNTKLFRRELIERYGLRYLVDMPVGSDQPFTIEACVRADRISVLADYDYYYAVKRLNARNITYRSRHVERLRCVESLMTFVADLIGPGKQRDAVLLRHFAWETARLLEDDFLKLDRGVQEQVHAGVRSLAERYLTDHIRSQLDLEGRLRISMAQRGSLDDLLAVIRQDAERGVPATVVAGDRWYAAYPGFRDANRGFPDDWFEVTEHAADWLAKCDVTSIGWEGTEAGRVLTVTARSPRADLLTLSAEVSMSVGDAAATTLETSADATGTTIRAGFPMHPLLNRIGPGGELRSVQVRITTPGGTGSAPVRVPRRPTVPRMIHRRGVRLHLITPTTNHKGQLVVAITPVTPRRVIARLRRRWPQGGK
ncbi:glycosyltransferase family 2 protein [Micromonospora echinofusca]|uniref:Glycosyltransferase n=1 Tax=Micromonospora echinofusca TaxID=47858 RepID=A0ABS3VRS3_MICEH|nr:glycosyltransferase family 2 protein [Micromonospora echinofusca]MBO4207241.1 glycosyltransferase [Micromonospora echinofusca]